MSTQQASTSSAKAAILQKNDNDVVIVCAVRSAITKGRKGGFKDTKPELILSHVLRAAYSKISLDPKLIEDISVGNVLPPGGGASAARMAALHAGIPVETSINTVNRQCSSGLTAINQIANQIRAGQIDIGIGAGVESMTHGFGSRAAPEVSDEVLTNQDAEDCLLPMGITSENVASDYNIPRSAQDAFSALSFQKAAAANKAGKFKAEIVPILAKWIDPKTEEVKEVLVSEDDGIREGVTAESLAKIKPAFKKDGVTHAGNASQVSDGAAAIILARRSVALRLGLPILGKFVNAATIGVPPRIMGVGPAYAIPRVLKLTGLSIEDVDFFEINEAFASQALFSIDTLKIGHEKVNLNGGAIALGHPLGCTGARQVATGLSIAKQTGGRVFVTSMCIGSGMGMAAVFVSEQ
ncbi:3-ketoacyl-CoA thiolase [Laccaria bicolor S238N-H82]|uniref:3-ketoacyl-CoA thiolase n=1 Tax=Laccaria bicolor (strain S238N-H82 / ATCC MYA-4686) TaxID=486041 RepID=B0DRH1_LACBS|nr:3-ketoacyl-CoA thiolase [Laccaria bicolor S238N-H82]EDR02871.1 3-ketoacyl-CoA thiolase [Laccaria bicolor S238N-H82]|eukprot:XP_001886581.1 3-ketoacyl-CoA thiolase [Laccaria bicolor S238N-H82]